MNPVRVTIVVVLILTALSTGAGSWIGFEYGTKYAFRGSKLDDVLHKKLELSPQQEGQIAALEVQFAADREVLEGRMRTANSDLARALQAEHVYGQEAKRAIAQFHDAMADLQELTIMHILSMRSVLTPSQAEQFDVTIREALSADSP